MTRVPEMLSLKETNRRLFVKTGEMDGEAPYISHRVSVPRKRIPRIKNKPQLSANSLDQNGNNTDHNKVRRSSNESIESLESLASDDTDLEIEEEDQELKRQFDPTGRRMYEIACKKNRVIASSRFARQLAEERLNMSKACLGYKDIQVMAFGLSANTTITDLNLSDNCIGPMGCKILVAALKENVFVKKLNLADNNLGTEGARAICDLFCENCEIRNADLSGNGFKGTDAEFFIQALSMNYMLKNLNLSHNEFREVGGEILAKALALSDSLEIVDLSWNHLRLRGGRAIGSALKTNQSIKMLDVSWNGISNDGAFYFAAGLKLNTTLQILDLTCNRITIEGTGFLFAALKVNETLQVLRIGQNPVTSMGVSKLLEAIKRNPNSGMESLELTDTPITFRVGAIISELQQTRPNFTVTHGGYVTSDDAYAKRYAEKYEIDPFFLLMSYVRAQGYRMIDMFQEFDTNKDWNISRAEFLHGLEAAKIPLTQAQLETVLKQLDKDDSGSIDLNELIKGEKEFKRKQRKQMKINKKINEEEFKDTLRAPVPNQPGNVRTGTLPDINIRGRPHTSSVRVGSARSQASSGKETPDMEMAGNVLDLVITTTDDNQMRIEGRPVSAPTKPKPIGPVPEVRHGFTATPPPGEWSPPTSPTTGRGTAIFNVVLNSLSLEKGKARSTNDLSDHGFS